MHPSVFLNSRFDSLIKIEVNELCLRGKTEYTAFLKTISA